MSANPGSSGQRQSHHRSDVISEEELAYRSSLFMIQAIDALRAAFAQAYTETGLTKADVARRIGKSRSVVTHALNGSRNLTLESISDLLAGMDCRPKLVCEAIDHIALCNHERSPAKVWSADLAKFPALTATGTNASNAVTLAPRKETEPA